MKLYSFGDDRDNLQKALHDWRKKLEERYPARFGPNNMEYDRLYGFHIQVVRIGLTPGAYQ